MIRLIACTALSKKHTHWEPQRRFRICTHRVAASQAPPIGDIIDLFPEVKVIYSLHYLYFIHFLKSYMLYISSMAQKILFRGSRPFAICHILSYSQYSLLLHFVYTVACPQRRRHTYWTSRQYHLVLHFCICSSSDGNIQGAHHPRERDTFFIILIIVIMINLWPLDAFVHGSPGPGEDHLLLIIVIPDLPDLFIPSLFDSLYAFIYSLRFALHDSLDRGGFIARINLFIALIRIKWIDINGSIYSR